MSHSLSSPLSSSPFRGDEAPGGFCRQTRPDVAQARDLREEASEATEAVADLQHHVRLATKDGRLTQTERDRLANVHAEAERQLRDVGDLIKREA